MTEQVKSLTLFFKLRVPRKVLCERVCDRACERVCVSATVRTCVLSGGRGQRQGGSKKNNKKYHHYFMEMAAAPVPPVNPRLDATFNVDTTRTWELVVFVQKTILLRGRPVVLIIETAAYYLSTHSDNMK